jgi:hypothetical protein
MRMSHPKQPTLKGAVSRSKPARRASGSRSLLATSTDRDQEAAADVVAAPVLRRLWRVLGTPGILREVVFGANPPPNFFAYSLDPSNPERFVRERADGHKELGRMFNGKFRKIRNVS